MTIFHPLFFLNSHPKHDPHTHPNHYFSFSILFRISSRYFSKNPGIFTPSRWIFSRIDSNSVIDSHIVINIPKFTLSLTSISTNAPKFLINSLLWSYKFHFLFSSFDLFYMQMSFSFLMCTFIEEERKPVNDKLQHNNGKLITIMWQAPHWYQSFYCYCFTIFTQPERSPLSPHLPICKPYGASSGEG